MHSALFRAFFILFLITEILLRGAVAEYYSRSSVSLLSLSEEDTAVLGY